MPLTKMGELFRVSKENAVVIQAATIRMIGEAEPGFKLTPEDAEWVDKVE